MTRPRSARHSKGGTDQREAAAEISIVRAVAPASRSGSHAVGTEVLPPVAWMNIMGLS